MIQYFLIQLNLYVFSKRLDHFFVYYFFICRMPAVVLGNLGCLTVTTEGRKNKSHTLMWPVFFSVGKRKKAANGAP